MNPIAASGNEPAPQPSSITVRYRVDDGGAGPAWGLWLPIGAAIWTLVLHGPLSELDE